MLAIYIMQSWICLNFLFPSFNYEFYSDNAVLLVDPLNHLVSVRTRPCFHFSWFHYHKSSQRQSIQMLKHCLQQMPRCQYSLYSVKWADKLVVLYESMLHCALTSNHLLPVWPCCFAGFILYWSLHVYVIIYSKGSTKANLNSPILL